LGPAHRVRRVDGEDLADHQPVEQHADRSEMQFDGRFSGRGLQHLYTPPEMFLVQRRAYGSDKLAVSGGKIGSEWPFPSNFWRQCLRSDW
jgi:hypothetical protein